MLLQCEEMFLVNTTETDHRPAGCQDRSERNDINYVSQVGRFAIVGLINTGVDLAVLNGLIEMTGRGRSGILYSVFKAISFFVAMVNSYFMNSRWTFPQKILQTARFPRFLSVSVAGLSINVGAASFVASLTRPLTGLERFWPSIAAIVGAACGLAFNFVGYRYWVFSPHRKPAGLT